MDGIPSGMSNCCDGLNCLESRHGNRSDGYGPVDVTSAVLSGGFNCFLCASEHLRGVASDEVNRLGPDESRQVNDLLDYEDSTFLSRLPSSAEISTESPRELEESFRDDLDIDMDAGRVVCLSVRKIIEKSKSLCSLRRLHMAPVEEAGEIASSTWEQGRALSADNEAGAQGTFDDTGQDGSEDTAPFWHDKGGTDSLASAVEEKMCHGEGKPRHPP